MTGRLARSAPRTQYAALPWRSRHGLEILLVSSRETGRWIIPKGWPIAGLAPHAAALREAFEEAGVIGTIERKARGEFHYVKRRRDGAGQLCRVKVFALKVERQAARWLEKGQRSLRWRPAMSAASMVDEPELRALIVKFARAAQARPKARSRSTPRR